MPPPNATQVDVLPFYAARPAQGRVYRLVGHFAVIALALYQEQLSLAQLWVVLAALVLLWFRAWKQVVGSLWRSSLVSALALCATYLSLRLYQGAW